MLYRSGRRNSVAIRKKDTPRGKKLTRGVKLSQDVMRQKRARAYIRSMRQKLSLKPVKEIGTGVDFIYNFFLGAERKTLRLDLKFSYGQLGDHAIKVRLNPQRKLLNNADWAMAIGKNNQIEFFPIDPLREYVRRNAGKLGKYLINKGAYSESAVSLSDFYAQMKLTPVVSSMRIESINEALKKIEEISFPRKEEQKNLPAREPKDGEKGRKKYQEPSHIEQLKPIRVPTRNSPDIRRRTRQFTQRAHPR
jgi:hypothetical protein